MNVELLLDHLCAEAPGLDETLALLNSGLPREAKIGTFLSYTEAHFRERNLEAVNTLLARVPLMHPIGLSVAFLRSTFRARDLLPAWRSYRDAVKTASDAASEDERNGFSTARLMAGLFDKQGNV